MHTVSVSSGHVLRMALSFAVLTGTPIQFVDVFQTRSPKGLSADKVMLINELAKGVEATTRGVELGSTKCMFAPSTQWSRRKIELHLDGSISLALDLLLLPILFGGGRTSLTLTGLAYPLRAPSMIFYKELIFRLLKPYLQRGIITIDEDGLFPHKGNVTCVIEGKYSVEDIPPKLLLQTNQELVAIKGLLIGQDEEIVERGLSLVELGIKPKPFLQTRIVSGEGMFLFLSAFYGDNQNYDNDHPFVKGFDIILRQPDELISATRSFTELIKNPSLDPHTAELFLPLLSWAGGRIPVGELHSSMKELMALAKQLLGVDFTYTNGYLSCDGYMQSIREE